MNKKDYLLGINNYCKTQHTMNEAKKSFLVKNYRKFSCCILGQDYSVTNTNQNFCYQKWLIKE